MKVSYCVEKMRRSNPRHTIPGYMLETVSKRHKILIKCVLTIKLVISTQIKIDE